MQECKEESPGSASRKSNVGVAGSNAPIAKRKGLASLHLIMYALNLQGTPSLIVIDRHGHMQLSHFGHASDLMVDALLGTLIAENVE